MYKVTVLCYCIENNVHHQKGVKSNLLAFTKTSTKTTEIITYVAEKLKSFKTSHTRKEKDPFQHPLEITPMVSFSHSKNTQK